MLNILVCVKQVPDVNLVKIDPATGSLIRAGVPAILNPLDGNALEAAVRTKEKYGGTVTVITRRRSRPGRAAVRPRLRQRRHAGDELCDRHGGEAAGQV